MISRKDTKDTIDMVDTLRWGILGTGRIARQFAAAVATAKHGRLVAVASRARMNDIPPEFGSTKFYPSYAELLAAPEVDAVYVAIPHPMHAEWAIKTAEAGKHVLCEKPIGMNAAEADAIIDAARRHDVFLMEAFMYRAHPQTAALVGLIRSGTIGEVRLIQASFGYTKAFDAAARQFAPELGGGGILDVGCYPVSLSRLVAGAAAGKPFADPVSIVAAGHLGTSGVDEWAAAILRFPGDLIAQVSTGVTLAQDNVARIFGTLGRIEVASPWFCSGREGGRSTITVRLASGESRETVIETADWLYAIEADHVAAHVAARQAPAMTWDDTLGNARALDAWRTAIGLEYPVEKPGGRHLPLAGRRLAVRPESPMPMSAVPNVAAPASRLALGTVGFARYSDAAPMFDAFAEAGGTTFDTAFHYGAGRADTILGHWLHDRGIRDKSVIIGKGAHTPNCNPEAVTAQLHRSLEMLQTDHIDVYFLHRDNPAVPVAEFVDVLDEHFRAGRIRSFGGSNWTSARIDEANAYAASHGREKFRHMSNQFSLADMIDAVWPGCISASDEESVAWLNRTSTNLFAWSSQARGFFTDRAGRDKRNDAGLARSWYSDANFARRDRAIELAERRGTSLPAIALAYVLAQEFPVYPLIGPLNLAELRSSLSCLRAPLTVAEARWLRDG
jgi:predicted dehydrogenase/aryl-alcohol dehydrogenase-like predicted oxidoreductase